VKPSNARRIVFALALFLILTCLWTASHNPAEAAQDTTFEQHVKPFLEQNCVRCHNVDTQISGVRVDHLTTAMEDRHLKLWEHIRQRVSDGTMPPKGQKQPLQADRERIANWIGRSLDVARLRPTPKNGLVRRLTIAQYRNTLRELLGLEDDLTEALPPDAISSDGFVNNKDTLQLSPTLLEAYLEIAGDALDRSIVDPKSKPTIQHFRMDLGEAINPQPFPEKLILGANSTLLENKDFVVSEPALTKPFAFEPFRMRTSYRFIEGYQGNDTVRGWREYSSIYHSVFACMRGKGGYPKGTAYSTVAEGLLLRPAIPNDELFGTDGTYGPRANFKISLRELPDYGRFRVTVDAAKYDDSLILDKGAPSAPESNKAVVVTEPGKQQVLNLQQAGIYQVDVHPEEKIALAKPDASRLTEGAAGIWNLEDAPANAKLQGNAKFVESPFGKAIALDGKADSLTVSHEDRLNVGTGDFTIAAWIYPREVRRAGIAARGGHDWTPGWLLEMVDNRGSMRLDTTGPDGQTNGSITTPPGMVRGFAWQHVTAVVRRGGETTLYVSGYPVAKGEIGGANLDNPKLDFHIGRIPNAQQFHGEIDDVRLYRRALGDSEIQALVEPGRKFTKEPPERPQDVTLSLSGRQFAATLQQPAFSILRLNAGPLTVRARNTGMRKIDRIVLTPLAANHEAAKRFAAMEKRTPRLGVYLGLRRDCGSTLAPVGSPQPVSSSKLSRFVFEGAIRNFPSPDVEKDNVNYLAGVREIGVRSEYTDGRDMPRLVVRSVTFEGPYYDRWPPATHSNIFVDFERKNDLPSYARHIVRNFASRAYRRPLSPVEESSLMNVYSKAFASTKGNFQQSIKDTLQVVLTSPQFLFLTETSSTPNPEPLDPFELSSKLSYFLWNGPPDAATLRLAAQGTLRQRIGSEVERMLGDAKSARFIREFTSQWLSLEKFAVLEPDRPQFPKLTRDMRAQLAQEPVQFLQYLIRNNLPVSNLISSDFVVANEAVANYYDMAEKTERGFDFTAIPHGRRELGGVLTQPAILAGLSDGRESNPVKRGAWVARKIVAEPPDPPPPNVPTLKEDTQSRTLRQRLEAHRDLPGCRQCHAKIDPWGIALEEFDAGGRIKTKPVDARSTLPDKTDVAGIEDLKRYLANDRVDQVAFSVAKHLATYANGRTLTYGELHALKQDIVKLKPDGYRMRDIIQFVANSKPFLEK
jgi:mono/diheme cytochrome c family protein